MKNYNVVYSILKSAIWGLERYPYIDEGSEDWEAVYTELGQQTVSCLAADVIGTATTLPTQLKNRIILNTINRINIFHRVMVQQQELLKIMNEAGIPFVILKGAAAAVYYPRPEHRTMGDVDFIVQPQNFDRAAQVMLENGFEPIDVENDRHYEYKKNGVIFELHRYFSLGGNPQIAHAFDNMIFEAIPTIELKKIENYSFPMLPATANGLVLLAHIDQHMEGGLGLRQIIDWMLFVDQELSEEKWSLEFEHAVRSFGLHKLAITVTRMCQIYLGLREEGISWCMDADEDLCRELIAVIMRRGNFGRKIGDSSRTIQAMNEIASISNLPKQLQQRGEANWKMLKKYPFLKPFAWIYQLFRYIHKGLSRKNAIHQLSQDVIERQKEANVLDQLEISHRAGSDRAIARRAGKQKEE